MSDRIFASDFKLSPYWWEDAPPFRASPELPERADLVIVGAGLCGLSAARRALELRITPLVLDAGPIGGGASSRSGAMVSSGQKLLFDGTSERLSPALFRELTTEHAEAFNHVRKLANSDEFGSVFQPSGRLFLAAVPQDLKRFAGYARILSEVAGMSAHVVGPADLRSEIDTSHYWGGLLVEEFGGMHPSRFAVALAKSAEREGAVLRSHTSVKSVEREPDGFVVRTSAGDVKARHVLFATNGYTDRALASVRRRLVPVGSYMIATAKMEREQVNALLPGGRMYSDTKRNLWYFRPSPDGRRILFGARPGLFPGSPEKAARVLHRFLARVFPALSQVPISYAWSGTVAMTRTHFQHIGEHDGCWFAVGCNASGVAIMPWLGRLAIDRMFGVRTTPTVFERTAFRMVPNIAGVPWYVPAVAGTFHLIDWLNRKRAGL